LQNKNIRDLEGKKFLYKDLKKYRQIWHKYGVS
jgi:hypothetical protein